jgi:streptomycin 6-kinase
MRLPPLLVAEWGHEAAWLDALPRLVYECAERWGLTLESAVNTAHSLVVPAGDVVLKLNAPPHVEAEHEPDALVAWAGDGAVVLVARDDARRAFLCERCVPGSHLSGSGADEIAVVCDLLSRLASAPGHRHSFRLLGTEADRWSKDVPAHYASAGGPFERTLLEAALDVYRSVDRSARWLVNQDLHGQNVLCAEREPWLLIDPKPLVGERELDGVGLLRNAGSTASVRRWLDALVELGLDRDRLRGWGLAHALAWGWDERSGWSEEAIEVARRVAAA